MNTYHITYIEKNQKMATGKRYQVETPIVALALFEMEFPTATFLYIASAEMFNYKY